MAKATSNTISWKLEDLLKFYLTDWVFTGVLIALEIFLNWIHPHERYVGEWMFVTGELRYPFKVLPVCSNLKKTFCIYFSQRACGTSLRQKSPT
jgi:hypothetical protein